MYSLVSPLFPDEPVWSGVSRACARYPSIRAGDFANFLLSGTTQRYSHFAFPSNAPEWATVFGYGDDHHTFVDRHTFWPWFRPFAREPHNVFQDLACSDLASRRGFRHFHALAEFIELCVEPQLKACRACFAKDSARYGVPYWHCVHQLAGLHECPHDGSPLVSTGIPVPAPGLWHYTPLNSRLLSQGAVTPKLDALQHYLAKNILIIPTFSFAAIDLRMRTALRDAGALASSMDDETNIRAILRKKSGDSSTLVGDELGGWSWILGGRAHAFPIHFLAIAFCLDLTPTQLVNYRIKSVPRGDVDRMPV